MKVWDKNKKKKTFSSYVYNTTYKIETIFFIPHPVSNIILYALYKKKKKSSRKVHWNGKGY